MIFNFSLVLRDILVQLFGLVGGVPSDGAHYIVLSGTQAGAQPVAMTLRVNVPPTSIVSQLIIS